MTQTPQLDVTPELRATVHAARIDVTYQPTQPDPAAQHPWGATIQRAVTVIFEAKLSDEATVAAADLLFMRAPHPDATPPPPLPPTTWHSGWRYRQPDDAAPELQLIVQLDSVEDWGYVIAFTPPRTLGARARTRRTRPPAARRANLDTAARPANQDHDRLHARRHADRRTARIRTRLAPPSSPRRPAHDPNPMTGKPNTDTRVEADHDSDERWAGGVAAPPAGVKRRSGCGHRALCGA